MIDSVAGVTQHIAMMALDALSLRHRVLANNIANINSEGYQPLRLNFEEQLAPLRAAVAAGAGGAEAVRLADGVSPYVEARAPDAFTTDSGLRLDEEISLVVQNTLQYQALITAMGRDGALMRIAITGETR